MTQPAQSAELERGEVDVTLRISRELERQLRGYLHYEGKVTLCLNGHDPAILAIWLDPDPTAQSDGSEGA